MTGVPLPRGRVCLGPVVGLAVVPHLVGEAEQLPRPRLPQGRLALLNFLC